MGGCLPQETAPPSSGSEREAQGRGGARRDGRPRESSASFPSLRGPGCAPRLLVGTPLPRSTPSCAPAGGGGAALPPGCLRRPRALPRNLRSSQRVSGSLAGVRLPPSPRASPGPAGIAPLPPREPPRFRRWSWVGEDLSGSRAEPSRARPPGRWAGLAALQSSRPCVAWERSLARWQWWIFLPCQSRGSHCRLLLRVRRNVKALPALCGHEKSGGTSHTSEVFCLTISSHPTA